MTRPDVFNWFKHFRERVATLKPDVVVVAFGGNDDKAYMTGGADETSFADFANAPWNTEYRRRVGAVLDAVAAGGGRVVWLGLPLTRDPEQSRRFAAVNAAVRREIEERPSAASYVDTRALFATGSGGYSDVVVTSSGSRIEVREPDGVHFTAAGGDRIAAKVVARIHTWSTFATVRKQDARTNEEYR